MSKIDRHQELLKQIHATYIQKNRAYGDSFDKSCNEFGITSAMIRLSDKMNRLKALTSNNDIPTGDESIKDTLLDLANYCVLTYLWLEEKENENEGK